MAESTKMILTRLFVLFILMFGLLLVLTWTNTIKCKSLLGWCDIYYSMKGLPKTAIVYGVDGLGDPFLLQILLESRIDGVGIKPALLELDSLALGNLKQYELVYVTRARSMSTEKMKMFVDFANQGGKLIWTGDAGTSLGVGYPYTIRSKHDLVTDKQKLEVEENYLFKDEVTGADQNTPHEVINPWARKLNGKQVRLDQLLSITYEDNYCRLKECFLNIENCYARISNVSSDHPLVQSIRSDLPFCFFVSSDVNKDFAVVTLLSSRPVTSLMTVNFAGPLIVQGKTYGKNLPLIISSSKSHLFGTNIGENVAYYALPVEYFANPDLVKNHRYFDLVQNSYLGMIYG
ncbi:MAG: hypothetical protein Q7S92_03285 [Candidatus Diapherotrites archaeon]|nr:hypothetical protein [Candidatus Diapherotrites archaeon]